MQIPNSLRFLRRPLSVLIAVGLAVVPVHATWTIVVLDTRTGEVIVAGATCIPDFSIPGFIGSVVVGKGGGASQAAVYHGAKVITFEGLQAGNTPQQILDDILAAAWNVDQHQFGVVGLHGPPVSYSGALNGTAALGATGIVGDLRYAIQGNVLAGDEVVYAAEAALLGAQGDLGQRVMAAMEAAAAMGGDGRCSCNGNAPASCGTPPPDFTHSAYTAFMILSRLGDIDSTTCGVTGAQCTNGDYYGKLNTFGDASDPDPILNLRRLLEIWRNEHNGLADHYLTEVYTTDQLLQADGADATIIDVVLRDIQGRPVVSSAQTLMVTSIEDPGMTVSSVINNGDGSYRFTVIGGQALGHARLRIVVQDGIRDVQLFPDVEFDVVAPSELFTNKQSLGAGHDGQIEFTLTDAANPGGSYHILGSASGTMPGTPWGSTSLPLTADRLLRFMVLNANGPALPNTLGALDGAGQATAWANFRSETLQDYVGGRFDFVAFIAGNPDRVTNLVGVDITL
ncbi:MAG: putative Ntn-hydrolase superfamily protein [Planctomycetota bacterium]|jgi:uncharacterized Ntn-hydrolase superfamily protein